MKRESRKAIYYLVVLPAAVAVLAGFLWARQRADQGIGNQSRACPHPDLDSLYGHQSVQWFPLRFRCEWFPPAPPTPAQETSIAVTVLLLVAVAALVAAAVVLWRTRAAEPSAVTAPVVAKTRTTTAQNPNHAESWDRVLAKLRKDGFSSDEAIKITRAVLHVTLERARLLVRESELWTE